MKKKGKIQKFYHRYFKDIEKSENLMFMIVVYYIICFVHGIFLAVIEQQKVYISIVIQIVSVIIIFFVYRQQRKKCLCKHIWSKRKMNLKIFFWLVVLNMARNIIFTVIALIIYAIKGTENVVIPGTVTDLGDDLDTVINAVVIGPIMEELILRGAGLSLFKKEDNKLEAIIFTSLILGLMHMNYAQFIYATLAGLLYGYVAIEFGIIYSIILHMLNNLMCYVEYFFNIECIMKIITVLMLLLCICNAKYIIKEIKEHINNLTKYSLKRQLAYFLNPILLLNIVVWIICIIDSIVKA